MKEKTKHSDVKPTSWLASGCRGVIILAGFLVILFLGGFLTCGLLYRPHDRGLTWSSDSRYLLVVRNYSSHYLYDVIGRTENYVDLIPPEISALFASDETAQDEMFRLSKEGTMSVKKGDLWAEIPNFEPLSGLFADEDGGIPNPYTFSPDKQWILNYQRHPDAVWKKISKEGDSTTTHMLVSQSRPDGLYLLPVDGHTEIKLIQKGPFEEIAWSPNGCYIAYAESVPPRLSIILASDWGLSEFVQPGADCKPYKAS